LAVLFAGLLFAVILFAISVAVVDVTFGRLRLCFLLGALFLHAELLTPFKD
jgi:hypothetical protein